MRMGGCEGIEASKGGWTRWVRMPLSSRFTWFSGSGGCGLGVLDTLWKPVALAVGVPCAQRAFAATPCMLLDSHSNAQSNKPIPVLSIKAVCMCPFVKTHAQLCFSQAGQFDVLHSTQTSYVFVRPSDCLLACLSDRLFACLLALLCFALLCVHSGSQLPLLPL